MSAASQARKRLGPDELEIVAFERGHFTSYSACGIPYWIGGAVKDRDALVARSPEAHRKSGIDVRMRHEVVGHRPGPRARWSRTTWPPAARSARASTI